MSIMFHRLHQLNMRIFKLKMMHGKVVDTLIHVFTAFFVFSKICTFVLNGVRIDDICCIFGLEILEFSC